MGLAEFPFTTLIVVLIIIISFFFVIRSFKMPKSFKENKEKFESLNSRPYESEESKKEDG